MPKRTVTVSNAKRYIQEDVAEIYEQYQNSPFRPAQWTDETLLARAYKTAREQKLERRANEILQSMIGGPQ
jgi:hypothetical protein